MTSALIAARPLASNGRRGLRGSNEAGHPSCQAMSSAASASIGASVPEGTAGRATAEARTIAATTIVVCARPRPGSGPGRRIRNTASAANAIRNT
jgi:hypothetical protein